MWPSITFCPAGGKIQCSEFEPAVPSNDEKELLPEKEKPKTKPLNRGEGREKAGHIEILVYEMMRLAKGPVINIQAACEKYFSLLRSI